MPGATGVVLLDADGVAGEFEDVAVGDAVALAVGDRRLDVGGALVAGARGVNQSLLLASQRASQHGSIAALEGRLVDVELVRIDAALDDVFAEAVRAGDQDDVAEAQFCVEREGDAAGGDIGAHHLHHADGEADLEMIEAIVVAIDDGAIGEHRREAAAARLEQLVRAADVEEALMLAGKARRRQILGRGRAADGHGDTLAILLFEPPVGFRRAARASPSVPVAARTISRACAAFADSRCTSALPKPCNRLLSRSQAPALSNASR